METQCLLKDGLDRRYFTPEGVATAEALEERTLKVSTKLLMYLKGRSRK